MELPQDMHFSVMVTQREFTGELEMLPTFPTFWAERQRPRIVQEARNRQCKLGNLRRLATLSRPDILARLAQLAARVNMLRVGTFIVKTTPVRLPNLGSPKRRSKRRLVWTSRTCP